MAKASGGKIQRPTASAGSKKRSESKVKKPAPTGRNATKTGARRGG